MKKIFLFAAAVVAAMTINAKVVDLTTAGLTIEDWTVSEATLNETASDTGAGKYVYDIKGGVASTSYVKAFADVMFQIKNGSDKAKAFVVYPGKCYEYGGKNGILIIENTQPGDAIILTAAAKGGTAAQFADPDEVYPKNAVAVSADLTLPAKGSEGADEQGYVWKTLEYQSIGGTVEIKEFAGGYRISKIQVGAGEQGIENSNAAVKAEKFFRNGQLIIRKNGVEYNAIGTAL
jgi:hypothetical protein